MTIYNITKVLSTFSDWSSTIYSLVHTKKVHTPSNSYASFVLSDVPHPSITQWLHATRLLFLKYSHMEG